MQADLGASFNNYKFAVLGDTDTADEKTCQLNKNYVLKGLCLDIL